LNSKYFSAANQRLAARIDQSERVATWRQFETGQADNTTKTRSELTSFISDRLKIPAQGGGFIEITPESWGWLGQNERNTAISAMKTAGFPDDSIMKYFRSVTTNGTPEEKAAAYDVFVAMRDAPNLSGQPARDLTADLDDDTIAYFNVMSDLAGEGKASQEQAEYAASLIEATKSDPWDNARFVAELKNDNGFANTGNDYFDWAGRTSNLTPENLDETIREYIQEAYFDEEGIVPTAAEQKRAVSLFKTYMQTGGQRSDADHVLHKVKDSMEGTWYDSEYTLTRTSKAPEVRYPEPPSGNIFQALQKLDMLGSDAILNTLGIEKGEGIIFGIARDYFDKSRASTFDVVTHEWLESWTENNADFMQQYQFREKGGGEIWMPGEKGQYILVPADKSKEPTYHVFLWDKDANDWRMIPDKFDPRPRYKQLTQAALDLQNKQAALGTRQRKALEDTFGVKGAEQFLADWSMRYPNMSFEEAVKRAKEEFEAAQ